MPEHCQDQDQRQDEAQVVDRQQEELVSDAAPESRTPPVARYGNAVGSSTTVIAAPRSTAERFPRFDVGSL
jgi:hypothetical protein